METPYEELVDRLVTRPEQVLVVVGSGLSVAATRNARFASWRGLLDSGLEYCESHCGAPESWMGVRRDQLKEGEYIDVASKISEKLGAPESANFASWLQKTVGSLEVSEPPAIDAIAAWGALIATTNYDTLITQCTKIQAIDRMDRAYLGQFVRGEVKRVLHLHGVWNHPTTVVFGAQSYQDVIRDRAIQDMMRALVISKSLVFAGCGTAGIGDPNIGGLVRWYRESLSEMICPSYILVRDCDREEWRTKLAGSQIKIITYGGSHEDLPGFLTNIAEKVELRRTPVRPYELLMAAQPGFDQSRKEILDQEISIGPAETIRRLMELVTSHWQKGGRRSALMSTASKFYELRLSLQIEDRVRYGLMLGEMFLEDALTDMAADVLSNIVSDIESDDVMLGQRHHFWGVQSRCLQALGPCKETEQALQRAISSAPDEQTKLKYEAELFEIRFLLGEDKSMEPNER